MKVKTTYPHVEKRKRHRQSIINMTRWPFWLAAFTCAVVNIATGGPAWSVIAIWSLRIVWSLLISPDLVEYNRISLWIRLITNTCILLIIIDLMSPSGWSIEVVSIVCFAGLVVAGVLFFTDLNRQKQNMMPMLILSAISLVSSITGLILRLEKGRWALIVMGVIALALMSACFIVLKSGFVREVKKRFHVK